MRATALRGCSSLVTLRFEAEYEGGGNGRSVATLRTVMGSVFKLKNITAGYTRVKTSGRQSALCVALFYKALD